MVTLETGVVVAGATEAGMMDTVVDGIADTVVDGIAGMEPGMEVVMAVDMVAAMAEIAHLL